jgi:hypothetical protein
MDFSMVSKTKKANPPPIDIQSKSRPAMSFGKKNKRENLQVKVDEIASRESILTNCPRSGLHYTMLS